ncbi:hypothetical protein ACFFX0_14185 [Citricoccus parietis]|uniref:Uncharacterized protein n=1 Tax=Citricoccus parietis TaxID=592307 RepID=A0ABV5G027_9MICC
MRLGARGRNAECKGAAAADLGRVGGDLVVLGHEGSDLRLLLLKFFAGEILVLAYVPNDSWKHCRGHHDDEDDQCDVPVLNDED